MKDSQERKLTEGQLEKDILEIGHLLRKKGRTSGDIKKLVGLFNWYCNHSKEAFRNMPHDLARYVASEITKYVNSPKKSYRPFASRSGRPGVIDWDPIHEEVELLLGLYAIDHEVTDKEVKNVFENILKASGAEADDALDQDTINSQIEKFKEEHSELLESG